MNLQPKMSGRSANNSDSKEKSIALEISKNLSANKISERSNTGEDQKSLTEPNLKESLQNLNEQSHTLFD